MLCINLYRMCTNTKSIFVVLKNVVWILFKNVLATWRKIPFHFTLSDFSCNCWSQSDHFNHEIMTWEFSWYSWGCRIFEKLWTVFCPTQNPQQRTTDPAGANVLFFSSHFFSSLIIWVNYMHTDPLWTQWCVCLSNTRCIKSNDFY